jgi:hypothetical protein
MSTLDNIEIQGQHLQWKSTLDNSLAEIKLMEHSLESMVTITNDKSKSKMIEHFQNQFIIQTAEINKLKNEILKHDISVSRKTSSTDKSAQEAELYHHNIIGKKVDQQELIVNKLIEEFKLFEKP